MTDTPAKRQLQALIPHRGTMLLLDEVIEVSQQRACAKVVIGPKSSFYQQALGGVPATIALEYMGQTAALIAGFQRQQGLVEDHLGFLLGSRSFNTRLDSFDAGRTLLIEVTEGAVVGNTLANFNCTVSNADSGEPLCDGSLSVLRQPLAANP